MKPTFKPGDKVRCVESDSEQLELGRTYEIVRQYQYNGFNIVEVEGIDDGWYPSRFELVEPAKPTDLPF